MTEGRHGSSGPRSQERSQSCMRDAATTSRSSGPSSAPTADRTTSDIQPSAYGGIMFWGTKQSWMSKLENQRRRPYSVAL